MSNVVGMGQERLELRMLSGGEVFPVLEIVDKLGLLDQVEMIITDIQNDTKELQDVLVKELTDAGTPLEEITTDMLNDDPRASALNQKVAVKIGKIVVRKIPLAEKEINDLLGKLTNTSASEVKKLPISEYIRLVMDFFKKPELKDLFAQVSSLAKSEE